LNYLLSFKLPFSSFQQRFPRYFPRVQILDTHVSASGYGPGLSNLAKTPYIGLVFDVTLCSFHTTQRLSRLDPDSLPCFLRRTSSNRTHTVPLSYIVTCTYQFLPSWFRALLRSKRYRTLLSSL